MRTNFASYTKIFDLSEFELERHASSLFSTNRSMLSTWQLQQGVDSISQDIAIRKQGLSNHLVAYLPELPRDTVVIRPSVPVDPENMAQPRYLELENDSLTKVGILAEIANTLPAEDTLIIPVDQPMKNTISRKLIVKALEDPLVEQTTAWPGLAAITDSLPEEERNRVYNRARSSLRSVTGQAESAIRLLPGIEESRVKHVYDMHMKYSMAVVCIIFVFIGAPMGAIVRKGGFGYPILVSIIFFVIFIILTIFCRKLAESFVVSGVFAGWLPCVILFPVSLWITLSAMNDAKLVSTEKLGNALRRARDSKQVAALRRAVRK